MEAGPTTRSRAHRRRARRRTTVVVVAILVVVLGAGIALASCSGGGGGSDATKTTDAPVKTSLEIPLGAVTSDSAGAPVTVTPDESQHVIDAITTYVKGATEEPLRTGKPATADFATVFDPNTLASATTADRGVLFDEGLPKVTGDLAVKAQPIALVGLGDPTGALSLITAQLVVDATGSTQVKGGPLHVVRTADLVFQPDATGAWKVTAYNVAVTRDGAGLTPTTTSTAAPTTGAKNTGAKKK
jgi:hypothetical protein